MVRSHRCSLRTVRDRLVLVRIVRLRVVRVRTGLARRGLGCGDLLLNHELFNLELLVVLTLPLDRICLALGLVLALLGQRMGDCEVVRVAFDPVALGDFLLGAGGGPTVQHFCVFWSSCK